MKGNDKLLRIYFIGIFLILTLPLFSSAFLFNPPAWGKTIFFRIILSILFFLFIYQILFKENNIDIKSLIREAFLPFWLLISLLGIYFLATVFSLDVHFSLWGDPHRAGGFINYAFYILFAVFSFLILKNNQWQKVWDFSLFIGALVSFTAIIQKLSQPVEQPVSTLGNPSFLAVYLILLIFLSLSFAIGQKGNKKYLYFFYFALFLFVIILTAVRSALLGFFLGMLFFILLFPNSQKGTSSACGRAKIIKIATLIILFLGLAGFFVLKNNPQIVGVLKKNILIGNSFERTWSILGESSIKGIFESRSGVWKIALKGIEERPILGYGPENFSILFDKYYEPTIKGIMRKSSKLDLSNTSWWDRGHNFAIDHLANAGVISLIIYILLIVIVFFQLQRMKKDDKKTVCHGIQAGFIGYLIAAFFSFDTFSTYLIFFLLIAYSFYIIREGLFLEKPSQRFIKEKSIWKYPIISLLFIILIVFIWNYNLKPLYANKEANKAISMAEINKQCDKAVEKMEKVLSNNTIIDNSIRLKYINIIARCIARDIKKYKLELSYRAVEILEENMEIRPSYTRTWQFAGSYISKAIESDKKLDSQGKKELAEKAYSYFKKALEINPNRPEIYNDIAILDAILKDFDSAEKNTYKCVELNPDFSDCWWVKAITDIKSGKIKEAENNIKTAQEKGYPIEERESIAELINIYSEMAIETNNLIYYPPLVKLYLQLIKLEPDNFQHHASLAFVYKTLGQYDKAREQALIVLKLSPESKINIEAFLKTLLDF